MTMYNAMLEVGISGNEIDNTEFELLLDMFASRAKKKTRKGKPVKEMSAQELYEKMGAPKMIGD